MSTQKTNIMTSIHKDAILFFRSEYT